MNSARSENMVLHTNVEETSKRPLNIQIGNRALHSIQKSLFSYRFPTKINSRLSERWEHRAGPEVLVTCIGTFAQNLSRLNN